MIITISGEPGSGKTRLGKALAKRLGYKFYSVGDIRGEAARERGLTIDQLNELGKDEDWTDKLVDDYVKKLGESEDNLVIDGLIAAHFIPHSIKIFLEVNPDIGAERIFLDQRPDEEKKETTEEIRKMVEHRIKHSYGRYKKHYNIDFLDKKHYDLVIDTSTLTREEVIDKVLEFLEKR
jgi:cytidylate kinase